MTSTLGRLGRAIFAVAMYTGVAVSLFFLFLEPMHLAKRRAGIGNVALACAAGACLFWISILLHELGHLLAAWIADLHVVRFAVGPLRLVRQHGCFKLRFGRSHYGVSGHVLAVPMTDHDVPRRMAIFIAGGPLVNLLLAAACLPAGQGLGRLADLFDTSPGQMPAAPWSFDVAWWLGMAGLLNAVLLFLTLAPMRTMGILTDGALILQWLGTSQRSQRDALTVVLQSALLAGVRPRDWSVQVVERMLSLRVSAADDIAANTLAYYYFLDSKNLERAQELLMLSCQQVKQLPTGFQAGILLEAAYFRGFHLRDADQARQAWQQAQGGDIEKQTWLRAEAALRFAELRFADATALAEAALAFIPLSFDPGGSAAEKEWLEELIAASKTATLNAGSQ